MRLIDAEAVYKDMKNKLVLKPEEFATRVHYIQSAALNCVAGAPTIEAKPVVYCKDCKYSRMYCFSNCEEPVLACCDIDDDGTICCAESVNEYDYCSKGEKRDAQMDELVSKTDELNSSVKIPVMSMKDICRKIMCDR